MRDPEGRLDPRVAWIAIASAIVIVYGSLYPFHFRSNPDPDGPFRALLNTWRGPFGRADFLANVLLYLPLGLFSIQALRRYPWTARFVFVVFCGLMLSVSMELIQFYDEGRVSALSDVYANTAGTAVGAIAGAILFQSTFRWRAGMADRPFVILLLSCWLAYRLFPYLPVIDLHKYWTAVKPLVFSPVLPPADLYRHTVSWLAVALLIEAAFGARRGRFLLAALVPAVLFARILLIDAVLSPAEVAGGALAAALWIIFLSRTRARTAIIAALFAGAVAIDALRPFEFSSSAHAFQWIPFRSFVHGSIEINIQSFLEKAFTYGALVWLIAQAGIRFSLATALSAGFVLGLRLIQVFIPGRSAEITDAVMVLAAAGVMKLMGERSAGGDKA